MGKINVSDCNMTLKTLFVLDNVQKIDIQVVHVHVSNINFLKIHFE